DDPNFSLTVLYMFNQEWYGAQALVLNRPYRDISLLPVHIQNLGLPIYWGGPISDRDDVRILSLCRENDPAVVSLDDAIKTDAAFVSILQKRPDCYRVFVGYAGWGIAQFEKEKRQGHWFVAPFDESVFELEDERMWDALLPYTEDKEKPVISTRQKM
ncbi:MAG: YqgE/AlgH family protein, partial [Chlamydiia bacterium]|nr:YqgE/AlgH family protein [Chlamydiia bacterium]